VSLRLELRSNSAGTGAQFYFRRRSSCSIFYQRINRISLELILTF